MKKKLLTAVAIILLISAAALFILIPEKQDFEGLTLKVASTLDISGGSYSEGAEAFSEKFGCTVEFTNDFENCDLIYSSGEDFSLCQPITRYINPRSRLYTQKIIDQSCTKDGEIYGITHALLGNINYCTYNPDQFSDTTLPIDRFKKRGWTWDGFIEMSDALSANISINWQDSYINMMYALTPCENDLADFDYGSQKQVEWLNFVRTLIYDEGIVNNTEGAFKVGFLPRLALDAAGSQSAMRYIPLPSKNGSLSEVFVDEYHFCVPKSAQNVKASVELANYIIKACKEVRTNLYKSQMTEEDYKIFERQLKKVYTYPAHTPEQYVPSQLFIDDFVHGKTVTEHIFNVENDALHIK